MSLCKRSLNLSVSSVPPCEAYLSSCFSILRLLRLFAAMRQYPAWSLPGIGFVFPLKSSVGCDTLGCDYEIVVEGYSSRWLPWNTRSVPGCRRRSFWKTTKPTRTHFKTDFESRSSEKLVGKAGGGKGSGYPACWGR